MPFYLCFFASQQEGGDGRCLRSREIAHGGDGRVRVGHKLEQLDGSEFVVFGQHHVHPHIATRFAFHLEVAFGPALLYHFFQLFHVFQVEEETVLPGYATGGQVDHLFCFPEQAEYAQEDKDGSQYHECHAYGGGLIVYFDDGGKQKDAYQQYGGCENESGNTCALCDIGMLGCKKGCFNSLG